MINIIKLCSGTSSLSLKIINQWVKIMKPFCTFTTLIFMGDIHVRKYSPRKLIAKRNPNT